MMAPDSNHEDPLDGLDFQTLNLPNGFANIDVGILPGIESRAKRTGSSNPKSSKKKNGYYHRRSGEKKERLIWTSELHQCFLEYYNQSTNEKRVPKKILEEMRKKFPYITRENIASHLQKHRLNLKNSKNIKEMGNSRKSSSKSVPRKVIKEESNFHQFCNNSTAAQFAHQSHTLVHDQALINQAISQFDEAHLSDESNNILIHGGSNIYSNMLNNNVLENQRNPFGELGQSSNAAINSDLFPVIPTKNHDQFISNIDPNANGFHPIMGNSFGALTVHDYSHAIDPNFLDYNMNLDQVQVDAMNNMFSLGSYSDTMQFDPPLNFNVANELQPQDFEQALQSILYPPGNHRVDDASTLPKNFRRSWEKRDE